jgi:8-oxo-dGTP pyrophosphatase MutT (NUDIX family)
MVIKNKIINLMITKKRWMIYQGAGLVILTKSKNNQWYVLLGKRIHNPGKNKWSVIGGQSQYNRKFKFAGITLKHYIEPRIDTCLREAIEEINLWGGG